MTSIPKILFLDIGGVLLSNAWGHESRQKAADLFNLDFPETEHLHNFIFNVYEIGKITLDEYIDIVVFNKERSFSKESFKEFMFAQSTELPGMLQWLKEWKAANRNTRIISINNEGKDLNDYRIKKFQLHQCFDVFVSSGEVGMRKPDPGIFQLAMGIAKVEPGHCFYFDDRIILAQAAARLGINAYQHQDPESTKEIIKKSFYSI
ncbi:MAG: HAD-IA family hydrolase [Chitinophagaceae bacterium]|nr:HAD-IA family hydrolase [Chitinophagaceae bacterium]